jgi:hypothetical protein
MLHGFTYHDLKCTACDVNGHKRRVETVLNLWGCDHTERRGGIKLKIVCAGSKLTVEGKFLAGRMMEEDVSGVSETTSNCHFYNLYRMSAVNVAWVSFVLIGISALYVRFFSLFPYLRNKVGL